MFALHYMTNWVYVCVCVTVDCWRRRWGWFRLVSNLDVYNDGYDNDDDDEINEGTSNGINKICFCFSSVTIVLLYCYSISSFFCKLCMSMCANVMYANPTCCGSNKGIVTPTDTNRFNYDVVFLWFVLTLSQVLFFFWGMWERLKRQTPVYNWRERRVIRAREKRPIYIGITGFVQFRYYF